MNASTLTDRGQVSVPAALRKAMNLRIGQRFVWERISDREMRVTVEGNATPGPLAALGYARRFRKARRSTADWMKELREGELA
jgi:bifunctional DNA-binding transcriptional regulator/antitoxin component of YhaV-PrlF toxin-antitoxin module